MDNNEVAVIAAAPGAIVLKQDGNFDRSCGFNANPWNGVIIQHADGSRAWYVHMKKSSVTAKPVGATVASGEYLGIVGSSGSSSGPHLHFELHDAGNQVIDPYFQPARIRKQAMRRTSSIQAIPSTSRPTIGISSSANEVSIR
jgi:murein DD-endopeptidase MepM/ murein hydrolase activator NlpD